MKINKCETWCTKAFKAPRTSAVDSTGITNDAMCLQYYLGLCNIFSDTEHDWKIKIVCETFGIYGPTLSHTSAAGQAMATAAIHLSIKVTNVLGCSGLRQCNLGIERVLQLYRTWKIPGWVHLCCPPAMQKSNPRAWQESYKCFVYQAFSFVFAIRLTFCNGILIGMSDVEIASIHPETKSSKLQPPYTQIYNQYKDSCWINHANHSTLGLGHQHRCLSCCQLQYTRTASMSWVCKFINQI